MSPLTFRISTGLRYTYLITPSVMCLILFVMARNHPLRIDWNICNEFKIDTSSREFSVAEVLCNVLASRDVSKVTQPGTPKGIAVKRILGYSREKRRCIVWNVKYWMLLEGRKGFESLLWGWNGIVSKQLEWNQRPTDSKNCHIVLGKSSQVKGWQGNR